MTPVRLETHFTPPLVQRHPRDVRRDDVRPMPPVGS